MQKLSYASLKADGFEGYLVPQDAPERVIQFGEGNFLRAFADRYFDLANELSDWSGKVVLVQPRDASAKGFASRNALNSQDCLYTVLVRGQEKGMKVDEARIVSTCSRCLNPYDADDYASLMELACSPDIEFIVSNTTEAGIVYDATCKAEDRPPKSFPAKLAQLLHVRFEAGLPGLIVLSCELIDHNGAELLRIVKQHAADWGWGEEFASWLEESCTFCTTLVDSIVPGRIRDKDELAAVEERLGYEDGFLAVREPFQMWGIEGDDKLAAKLPFIQAKVPGAFVVPDVTPYKKRKVRILNGAHTGFVPGAFLAGFTIVRDCMHDETVSSFMDAMLSQEVIPTLAGAELSQESLEEFADAVRGRFDNPFVDHQLLSICLNSTAKWRARNLPSLEDYVAKTGKVPVCLATSLACLIAFYTCGFEGRDEGGLHLRRPDGLAYAAQDDASVLDFYAEHASDSTEAIVDAVLGNEAMWGKDLRTVAGLQELVTSRLALIRDKGTEAAFKACL